MLKLGLCNFVFTNKCSLCVSKTVVKNLTDPKLLNSSVREHLIKLKNLIKSTACSAFLQANVLKR